MNRPQSTLELSPIEHTLQLRASSARLLVFDPDVNSGAAIAELGRDSLLSVVTARDADEAVVHARDGHVDVALIDVTANEHGEGFRLAHRLRALPGYERLPIGFVSAAGSFDQRIAAAHAGGSVYLAKPLDPYVFDAAVQQLLALGRHETMRVLILDDDQEFASIVEDALALDGTSVVRLADPSRVLEVLEDVVPDLLLLDVNLPGANGFEIARMLRTTPEWQEVPIVFLTGCTDVDSRVAAFEAGGDDYLAKPIVLDELLARVRVRLDRRRLLREVVEKDPVTKLLSRRALLEGLGRRLSEARRHERPLSLALLDVDGFKAVNDRYGHLVGDHVLAGLGRLLNERFRLEDLRGRWGGEEFIVVFPGEKPATAAAVLERVLDEFRQIDFVGESGEPFHVTFSAGIASYPADGASVDALVRATDLRLYEAKRDGKNQVARGPGSDIPPRRFPFVRH